MTSSFLPDIQRFHFRPAMSWDYTMYSQYMGGLVWSEEKTAENDVIYE